MGGDRIAGPKVMLVVDIRDTQKRMGSIVPSIMGNEMFISGVSIEQPGFHEMGFRHLILVAQNFLLVVFAKKTPVPRASWTLRKSSSIFATKMALEDVGPVVGWSGHI